MKRIFLYIFTIILCCFYAISAYSSEDVFTISNIDTSYDAGNLEDSKQIAIDNAIMQALHKLLEKISPTVMHSKISNYNQITNPKNFVSSVTPTYERMTSHSYMAKLDITFNQQAVQNILNSIGIIYRKDYAPQTLIIPILYKNNKTLRWHTENWRNAWRNMPFNFGLQRLKLISNNLEELEKIRVNSALIDPIYNFTPILSNHDTEEVIIIFAEEINNNIELTIRFLGSNHDYIKYYIINKKSYEPDDDFYKRVVSTLITQIDNKWKGVDSFNDTLLFSSKVNIELLNPKTWSAIRTKLQNIPQLENFQVLKATLKSIQLEMHYKLPSVVFSEILYKNGLRIEEKNSKLYLKLRD